MKITLVITVLCVGFGAGGSTTDPSVLQRRAYERAVSLTEEEAGTPLSSFVVVGDTQQLPVVDKLVAGGPLERKRIRRRIRELRPDLRLHAGDIVTYGGLRIYWRAYRKEYRDLPFWPVLGNHDLFGSNLVALASFFSIHPRLKGRRFYLLRRPPLAFLMLDSNFGEMSAEEIRVQQEWFVRSLEEAERDGEVRAVMLVVHHPPFSAHMSGGNERVRRLFWDPAMRFSKVVAVFSGHHHDYQHIRIDGRHAFVTGGGGAPLYFTKGPGLPAGAELLAAVPARHLICGKIEKGGISLEMHRLHPDGSFQIEDPTFLPWPDVRRGEPSLEIVTGGGSE